MKRFAHLTDSKSTAIFHGENPTTQKTSVWNTWHLASSQIKKFTELKLVLFLSKNFTGTEIRG